MVASIVDPMTIAELVEFSKKNTVLLGFLFGLLMGDILSEELKYDSSPLFLEATVAYANVEHTTKEVNSGSGVRYSSSISTSGESARIDSVDTRVEKFQTLHGIEFDASVTWVLKRGGVAVSDPIVWSQKITRDPTLNSKIRLPIGETQEFEVGALFHLAHQDKSISEESLRVKDATAADYVYPRHNKAVDNIMEASANMTQLIDFMTISLARHTGVTEISGRVVIPWSVHTIRKPEGVEEIQESMVECDVRLETNEPRDEGAHAPKPLVDSRVFDLLQTFHQDNARKFLKIGEISMLLQKLMLLKVYIHHFNQCFNLIEEQQIQAFLSGIGKTNAALFAHTGDRIDSLLYRVASHKATKNRLKLKSCSDSFTASSFRLEARLPGEIAFSTMHAVESRSKFSTADGHYIKFRGPGDSGVPVEGDLVRRVLVLPTARSGLDLPSIRLSAGSLYGKPVLVSIGAMGGHSSTGKSLFLLGDGMQLVLALSAAALPSNAAFQKSMSLVPDGGMREFMDSVRAADLAESGLCIDVMEMRPLLAHALGIKESDLVGRRDKEKLLIEIVKAGASLSAIAATIGDNSQSYDLDAVFTQLDLFAEAVLEQGKLDQSRKRKYEEMDREEREQQTPCVYRSLGASVAMKGCRGVSTEARRGGGGSDESGSDGELMNGDGSGFEHVSGEEGGSAKKKTVDIMTDLLSAFGDKFEEDAFSACKIDMGNPKETMQFAQSHMPDKLGNYVEQPHRRDWHTKGPEAAVIREALVEFVEKSPVAVKTTRIVYYIMYAHAAPSLMRNLLRGGHDPTTVHMNMFKEAQCVLNRAQEA